MGADIATDVSCARSPAMIELTNASGFSARSLRSRPRNTTECARQTDLNSRVFPSPPRPPVTASSVLHRSEFNAGQLRCGTNRGPSHTRSNVRTPTTTGHPSLPPIVLHTPRFPAHRQSAVRQVRTRVLVATACPKTPQVFFTGSHSFPLHPQNWPPLCTIRSSSSILLAR